MSQKKPNILLFAVDSLLATHMSLYGYHLQTTPHLDVFAEEATVFENNISAHIPTTPAYASMLTGKDCFSTNIVALRHKGSYAEGVTTLPELLRQNGYDTVCVGFGGNPSNRGFDRYLEYKAWGSLLDGNLPKADNLNKVFLPELDKLAKADKPFFVMLRHMEPHSPYLPPPPFDRMFYHGDECDPKNKSMEPVMAFKPFRDYFTGWMPPGITDKDYVIAQYDGAIAYLDVCIQRIFTALENLGILDETIIVLNGDHGETLYDHECWFDHHGVYDVTLKVPLLIRYPAKVPGGLRIGGFTQHKNLVPTLLELAEINTEIQFDGESLMRLVEGDAHSFESGIYITECTWMRKHGWRTPEWKLIVALEPDFHFKPPVELYNLVTDPDELDNVADKHPEVVAHLRGLMTAHIAKRTAATGRPNPMENQPHWHGNKTITYFESSQQAYDTLHIGDPETARKLQAAKAEQQAKQ